MNQSGPSYRWLLLCAAVLGLHGAAHGQWNIQDVDAPRSFLRSSIRLNSDDWPRVAYGGDHLYYAEWDGSTQAWTFEAVDRSRGAGAYPSLALDSALSPGVSYFDAAKGDLKFARRNGPDWTVQTVDAQGIVGWHTSLAFDSLDQPIIAYYDVTNGDLKVARWQFGIWNIETIDATGNVGMYCSMEHDNSGNPLIAYYDTTNGDLKLARWNGAGWDIDVVASSGDVGTYCSLGIGKSGGILIAHFDRTNSDLRVARWTGTDWQTEIVDQTGDVGSHISLAVENAQNDAALAYYDRTNGDLKYAYYDKGIWYKQTADAAGDVGQYTSLALGTTFRFPHITYFDATNAALKYARSASLSPFEFETLDHTMDVGRHTSIEVNDQGMPQVSYFDATHGDLKAATFDGIKWRLDRVDTAGKVGEYSSLEIGPSETPSISYYDGTNQKLKFAQWNGVEWEAQTLPLPGQIGQYSSLAFDPSGNPNISCYDAGGRNLVIAQWGGGNWDSSVVDSATSVGMYCSLAFDAAGRPAISYYNSQHGNLKFAKQVGFGTQTENVQTSDNVGWHSSLAYDPSGNPGIGYYDATNRDLKLAWWTGTDWNIQTVDSQGDVGAYASLAFNPQGHPCISYLDWTGFDLKYARWDGSAWQIETVDSYGEVGQYTSLAFDAAGNPFISYYDNTNGYLKVAAYPYLRFAAFQAEDDRCALSSPPDGDGRVNPGEEVDLRIFIKNVADFAAFTAVTALVRPVTLGVDPSSAVLDLGDIPAGQQVPNLGDPLTVTVPVWLTCGDEMLFSLGVSSVETGQLAPQYFTIPVDGDPANCACEAPPPDIVFDAFAIEDDLCPFAVPPGQDGRANPGEDIELRLFLSNLSPTMDYTGASARLEPLNPEVAPPSTTLVFGTIPASRTVQHLGDPVTLNLPATVPCGDVLVFRLIISTNETGPLVAQYFTVPVDGDPANCACEEPAPDLKVEGLALESDQCLYASPPGSDGRASPGESVDFRLSIQNDSSTLDYTAVTATVEAVSSNVQPAVAIVDFGTIPAGETGRHAGAPLTFSLGLSYPCGQPLGLRVTIASAQTGTLTPQLVSFPVGTDEIDCVCLPVGLFYQSHTIVEDRCDVAFQGAGDGRINPGERVDIRLKVRNGSSDTGLTLVTGTVQSLTSGVEPDLATLEFGTIPAGQTGSSLGDPLTLVVPTSLTCGDEMSFLIQLSSAQTGMLQPQAFTIPVNGDPNNCECADSPGIRYNAFDLEDDRCALVSPLSADGRVNPGEEADLRIEIQNTSQITDLDAVSALIEPITPDVTLLSPVNLDFGTVPAGQSAIHLGVPLTVGVPLSVGCGDLLTFRITLFSAQTGALTPETFTVPVDGDPAKCSCDASSLPKVHRGTVAVIIPGWKRVFLPLTPGNDDEEAPFPAAVQIPAILADDAPPAAPLVLYRVLDWDGSPGAAAGLMAVKTPSGIELHVQ